MGDVLVAGQWQEIRRVDAVMGKRRGVEYL